MFAKVMFLHMSVILFTGQGEGVLCLQAHTQGGLRGLAGGGLQAHIQGDVGGLARGVQAQVGVNPSMHLGRHPPSRRQLLRKVRILLECILVIFLYIEIS